MSLESKIPDPVSDVVNGKKEIESPVSTVSELFKGIRGDSNSNDWVEGIMNDFTGGINKWLSETKRTHLLNLHYYYFEKLPKKTKKLAEEVEQNGNGEGIQGSFDRFSGMIDKYTSKYDIPDRMLAKLIDKEGSRWNTGVKAEGSTGFGLGQHIEDTWILVRKTILQRDGYDIGPHRTISPEAQIYATAEYLSQMKQKGSWEEAMAYYNTGPNIKNISQEEALKYARKNPVISNIIPGVVVKDGKILEGEKNINPDSYFRAAVAYYNDTPYKIEPPISYEKEPLILS